MATTPVLAAASGIVITLLLFLYRRSSRGDPFPGPSAVPIFGNALQLPRTKAWEKLHEWGQAYGGFYSIQLLGTPCLVLNTAAAAREVLESKSAFYSNRPLPKIIEMSGFDKGVVLEHDPSRLRHARKLLNTVLGPRQLPQYRDVIMEHVNILLYNLLNEPVEFIDHIRHLTAGVAMEISHGHKVTSRNDPYVKKANEFGVNFAEASLPTKHLVDRMPFLARLPSFLPGMGFQENARVWREHYFSLAEEGHQMVKDQIARGIARPSLTYKALAESKAGEHPDDIIMFTATQVYAGGSDTTVSSLASFILFMVKYPEVQKKAQEEIQRVIGSDRLPVYEDRANLSYVESVMIESLRLRPPVSTVGRLVGKDDVHQGHYVAKDTIVLVNFWGMLRNEEVYPDPHTFKPERWIGQDRRGEDHPLNVAFGFGRRICPGQYLAEEIVFTSVARILALFTISPVKDGNGDLVIPSDESTNGGITFPTPFQCNIQPRTSRTKEVLQGLVGETHD